MTAEVASRHPVRPRNAPEQYDDLAEEWWRPDGAFAALHWLAGARARHLPAAAPGAVLVDVACGGGLMAPHVAGYRHVGVDLNARAAALASVHGVSAVVGDARQLPLADEVADVVVAGEVFEHVADVPAVVAEVARVLKRGGTVVFDTINATSWARFSLVTVAERLPGGPPPRIHDPALFVPPDRLVGLFSRHGVAVDVWGLQPHPLDYLRFLVDRRRAVRMVRSRSVSALYQGVGRKLAGAA